MTLALAACSAIAAEVEAGTARYTWFGLPIYDARLLVGEGFRAGRWQDHAFTLELTYRRELRGRDIASRSIVEMRRLGRFDGVQASQWEAALARLLPDVRPGDRIAGLHRPGRGAVFEINGRPTGELADPAFAVLFFGIWLAPQTSEPALRAALLERAPP